MLKSLRSKLIASYIGIVLLCLLLTSGAFLAFVPPRTEEAATGKVTESAVSILNDLGRDRAEILRTPATTRTYLEAEAQKYEVRILIVRSQGEVAFDSEPDSSLEGQSRQEFIQEINQRSGRLKLGRAHGLAYIAVPLLALLAPGSSGQSPAATPSPSPTAPATNATPRASLGGVLAAPAQATPAPTPQRRLGQRLQNLNGAFLVVAIPETALAPDWRELLRTLGLIILIVLGVSLVAAFFLAGGVLRPVRWLTKASSEMAKGKYNQTIPVEGHDEMARLAETFNGMAQEVNRSHQLQRDFLANVSHELKTPLTSIQGFSAAVLDGTIKEPDGYHKAAQIINDEARSMNQLVNDLLDLSKLEVGQVQMARDSVDLRAIIQASAEKVEWRAQQAHLNLDVALIESPHILGDPHWLQQVFSNLLDNAVKNTPEGGAIRVEMALEPAGAARTSGTNGARPGGNGHKPASAYVRTTISNTGPGITSGELPRIFDRFYQTRKPSGPGRVGHGLGLAIVKEIVQAHGGSISASSEPGAWTQFTVRLPVTGSPSGATSPHA